MSTIKKTNQSTVSMLDFAQEYKIFLSEMKDKVRSARLRSALAVNRELIDLYWHIGKQIIEKQNWGSKLIETLSKDLQNAFPETSGFSVPNLKRMRLFAQTYPNTISSQSVSQLPWGHISVLIHRVSIAEI